VPAAASASARSSSTHASTAPGTDRFYGSVPGAVEACVELLRAEAEAAAGTRPP